MDHETMNLWDDQTVVTAFATTAIDLAEKTGKWYACHIEQGRELHELVNSLLTFVTAFSVIHKRYNASKKTILELSAKLNEKNNNKTNKEA